MIAIVEKRRKIAEIDGNNIYVWEFFEVLSPKNVKKWCKERGFYVPVIMEENFKTAIDHDYRIFYRMAQ